MISKRGLAITALTLLAHGTGIAGNDAGLPGEFLNFGVGARPLAMGRAFTAVADDIDSIYWNPAGLSSFRSNQVTFQHSPLILEGAYQYAAYSQPLYALGNLGVGVVNLSSPDVPRIDGNNIEIGTFDKSETGYLVAYAHRVRDDFAFGTTFKMAEHTIAGNSERGFGADVGSLYRLNERVQFGAMLRNALPPSYSFSSEKEQFPTVLRTGASANFLRNHLLTAIDLEKTLGTRQSLKWHFGVEGYVIQNIFFRAGIDPSEITGGVGIRWRTIQFDYAAGFQDLGFLNRFSVKLFFGGYEVDVKAEPTVFSPVGIKNKVFFRIATSHRERVVNWILSIRNSKGEVVKSFQGYNAPPATLEWDGRNAQDQIVEPGLYTFRMSVTDTKKRSEMTPPRTIKIVAPSPIEIEAR